MYTKKEEVLPTGTCLILVTPDSERTMCTFLGIAGKINQNDINLKSINESEMIFLEGYLWDEGDPKKLLIKQSIIQKKLPCHYLINSVLTDIKRAFWS